MRIAKTTTQTTILTTTQTTIDNHNGVVTDMDADVDAQQDNHKGDDRIPSTTPGAEPPRDARDSGSARSHSTHLETSSSNRP